MSDDEYLEDLDGFAVGQTEPLTTRLRGLIHAYPEGLGIVKELLQNADDSGARTLHLIIDWRTHPTELLPDPRMAALQGPSLLAVNDREFTEDDVVSIQQIGHGGKLKSAAKTGRFGLGFNAVYNVTDWPSFITGGRLFYFDPHLSAVPGATSVSPGYGWKLGPRTWEKYADMLTPFGAAGLVKDTSAFNGTIFRLSLRTSEQAKLSEIRHQPFGRDNVKEIIQELLKAAEQLLLFLKNIEELHVSEIEEDGTRKEILSIVTTSPEPVRAARQKLMGLLVGDSLEVLDRLESSDENERVSVFAHSFQITTAGKTENATWQIVSGLFADDSEELTKATRQMADIGEKAVPWAGAAAQIGGSRSVTGTVYCSLPLPIQSGLPIHIHGFFDLDSSRSALTAPGGQTGTDRVRGEWNRLLLRHGVAVAYAKLLGSIAPTIGESSPETFYGLWPSERLNSPFDELEKSVARQLGKMSVIRTAGAPRWANAREVWVLPENWDCLQAPFVAEELPFAEPPLTAKIRQFLANAGVVVDEYSPADLRKELSEQSSFQCPIAEAPRVFLRRRDWVVEMLKFCLHDAGGSLAGLPLALLANGELRAFPGVAGAIYLAGTSERRIFETRKQWFIDESFARECGLIENRSVGLVQMTLSVLLDKLKEFISVRDVFWNEWNLASSDPPNVAWLIHVYNYLTNAIQSGLKPDKDAFKRLALVPTRGNKLFAPGYPVTPLLARDEIDDATRQSLSSYGVRTVDAPPPLRKAIVALFDSVTERLILPLTGPDVVGTLADLDEFPSYNPLLHGRLLDYLSDRRWLDGPDAYDDKRKAALRDLPIFPTSSGELVPLGDEVFRSSALSSDIRVPLKLLKPGPNDAWAALYKFLDVPLLDRAAFIREGLLPGYSECDDEMKLRSLQWIRDNLDQTETELEGDDLSLESLSDAIKDAKLIKCKDGEFRPPSGVFDPSSSIVGEVLGSDVPLPDMDVAYARGANHWLKFFRRIGMVTTPSGQDIACRIDRIIEAVKTDGTVKGMGAVILRIYTHVLERWVDLRDVAIRLVGGTTIPFSQVLRARAWLPVDRNTKELERYAAFLVPDDRLYKPSEIRFGRQAHLVASQSPIFRGREPESTVKKALGFPEQIPLKTVLAHFDVVIARWQREGHSLEQKAFGDSVEYIYKELHRVSSKESDSETDAFDDVDLVEYFDGKPCIWNQGKFWKPEHVFQIKAHLFGKRRVTIPRAKGRMLEPLGIRSELEAGDFISYIKELAEEFGTEPLPDDERTHLVEIFRRLGRALSDQEPDSELYVLTDDWRLRPAVNVFSPDAAWLEDRLDRSVIHLLHGDTRSSMEQAAGVKSLTQSVIERPIGDFTIIEEGSAAKKVAEFESVIRTAEFRKGIERLIWSARKEADAHSLDWLEWIEVSLVDKIATELYAEIDGFEQKVGAGGTTDFYFDEETTQLFLASGSKLIVNHLARALVSQIDSTALPDQSPIVAMLESSPEDIDSLLDELKIRRPPQPDAELSNETEEAEDGEEEVAENPEPSNVSQSVSTNAEQESPPVADSHGGTSTGVSGTMAQRPFGTAVGNPTPPTAHQPVRRDGGDHRQTNPRRNSGPPVSDSRRRDRVVTYVQGETQKPDNVNDENDDATEDDWKVKFGAQAVEFVCSYERDHGREPTTMGQTSPGYDVESLDKATGTTRFIEVKANHGAWSPRGVGLSSTQFEVAQAKKSTFWLYVVEHADALENAIVHAIQDPFAKVTQFRFDDGWKGLATIEDIPHKEPVVGKRISIEGKGDGTIQVVTNRGQLRSIEVALIGGIVWKGAYNPSTMKVQD